MEVKNILVPVDGSEGSDRAVTQAISLAEACGAKLNFLYVANINQLAINACLSDAILDAVTKAGNVILDRVMDMVPTGVEKEAFSETGSPAVVILDFATDKDMDMIVIAARQREPVHRRAVEMPGARREMNGQTSNFQGDF